MESASVAVGGPGTTLEHDREHRAAEANIIQVSINRREEKLKQIRIYPGSDATFEPDEDDGTYDYERASGRITVLHWDERDHRFTHAGARAWSAPDSSLIKVIHASN